MQSLVISLKKTSVQNQKRKKETYPDDWIDEYVSGQDQLKTSKAEKSGQGYDGSPMKWYRWIGLYQATIHDTNMRTAEKLAVLQHIASGTLFNLRLSFLICLLKIFHFFFLEDAFWKLQQLIVHSLLPQCTKLNIQIKILKVFVNFLNSKNSLLTALSRLEHSQNITFYPTFIDFLHFPVFLNIRNSVKLIFTSIYYPRLSNYSKNNN